MGKVRTRNDREKLDDGDIERQSHDFLKHMISGPL